VCRQWCKGRGTGSDARGGGTFAKGDALDIRGLELLIMSGEGRVGA
jgi:hypothetical protein